MAGVFVSPTPLANPLEAFLLKLRGPERVTTSCVYCSFIVSASVAEAHAAFERHRCRRPRPTVATRRRRPGIFALR